MKNKFSRTLPQLHSSLRIFLSLALTLGLPMIGRAQTIALPISTGASQPLDAGAFPGGANVTLSFSGDGDVIDARYTVQPDGSLKIPASGTYSFANNGAAYPSQDGGDGINHYPGGGANFDASGSGYPFAGKVTTDTTDPATIRIGAVVGTFSNSPTRADWFFVGSGATVQIPAGGAHLYLAVNDTVSGDNHGTYSGILSSDSTPPVAPAHGGLSATTFQVNESSSPTAGLNDSVLRFSARQAGYPAGLSMRVQSSTNQTTWTDLTDGAGGLMSYAPQVTGYVLHSTSYPTSSAVYFRAVAKAGGYADSISNVVGPFNLSSSTPHLAAPLFFITTNGEINAIRFGVKQTVIPSGVGVRVQTTQTPANESSWTDAPVGNSGRLVQDTTTPDLNQFYLGTDEYPAGEGVYFRAVSSAPGYVDGLSFYYGPLKFVRDPAPSVTITIDGQSYPDGNSLDESQLLPPTFNVRANVSSGRFIKRLTLLLDGVTAGHFDNGTTTGSLDYQNKIAGDHIIEAYATDDLGVTGAAPPVHVRTLPLAPGKIYQMTQSGNWNTPSNWISIQGDAGVPGSNDFAIIGSFSPTLTTAVTVKAASLNGGTISGAKLTVTGFCTIAAGSIRSDLSIPSGSTCEFINDADVGLTGTLDYAGVIRLHGKGGITGIRNGSALRKGSPDGIFDGVLGVIKGVGKFFADLASGGRKGSKSSPPAAANPLPKPEQRVIQARTINIAGGQLTAVPAPLISQDGAGVISHDAGGVVSHDAGGLVAQGGGNLVAQGGGNVISHDAGGVISHDAGGVISHDAGGLVAQGGGNLVATGGGNLVAQGGGNLIAQGGGNLHRAESETSDAANTDAGFYLSGGEVNLSGFTIEGTVQLDSGILSGSGLILGDLNNDGAYISPGHSAGALAITGSFSQGPNGTLILENGGSTPDSYDDLFIGGNATLGGKLNVKLINGYVPDADDTYNPITADSLTGNFSAVSSNAQVTATGSGLVLTNKPSVANPRSGQLVNISTRMRVGTGDNVMIAGFIITGSSPKKVLVRALGPDLTNSHVAGALADPTLELHQANGVVTFNDNWKDTQQSEIAASGIAPRYDAESAIIATLQPGAHTAIVRGKGDSTGVGLVEVYDLEASADATLANISTRGLVQTGDNVMIGGVIIQGSEPAHVLIRALGPSLSARGVSGALADPMLELHDANGGVLLNDNWADSQEAEIYGSTIAPTDAREAAIYATLVPSAYTAIVRGKDDTTGVALVEAYVLP